MAVMDENDCKGPSVPEIVAAMTTEGLNDASSDYEILGCLMRLHGPLCVALMAQRRLCGDFRAVLPPIEVPTHVCHDCNVSMACRKNADDECTCIYSLTRNDFMCQTCYHRKANGLRFVCGS